MEDVGKVGGHKVLEAASGQEVMRMVGIGHVCVCVCVCVHAHIYGCVHACIYVCVHVPPSTFLLLRTTTSVLG